MGFTHVGKGLKHQAVALENSSHQNVLTSARTQTENFVMASFSFLLFLCSDFKEVSARTSSRENSHRMQCDNSGSVSIY